MTFEVMLDIETLSTRPNSAILTIACIKFDRTDEIKNINEMETFYRRITLESCNEPEFHKDPKTIEWWELQSDEIKEEAFHKERVPLREALIELQNFFKGCYKVWSNGSSFDCVIVEEAYRKLNLKVPWNFWNVRDCRTIMDIGNVKLSDIVNPDIIKNQHHALYDSYRQILALKKSFKNIRTKL